MTTTIKSAANKSFEYGFARVRNFSVNADRLKTDKSKGQKVTVKDVEVNGRPCLPSKRFWTSIQCRFGFSSNVFRYFDHKEVFDRISEKSPNDQVRYCIEHDSEKDTDTLLAVTNPNGSAVHFDQLQQLLGQYGADNLSYDRGIVRSLHKPRVGSQPFEVAGDQFLNQFVIDTPIDGFGKPNIYLSLLRLICTNGAIGFTKAFRSELNTGKKDEDVAFSLIRAMDGFNNEDGFMAMRNRFEAATMSWASVNEVQKLYKVLASVASNSNLIKRGHVVNGDKVIETALPIFDDFHKVTGDVTRIYGLSNLDNLSIKRQRTLPVACKVYDLLNFATEVATHHAKEAGNRRLQAYIGDLISTEYDLEGTVDQFSDWQDFFIGSQDTSDTMKELNRRSYNN